MTPASRTTPGDGPARHPLLRGRPLILRPDIRVGTLCLIDTRPRDFTAEQARQLEDLARIVVAHLRLHDALRTGEALARDRAVDIAAREQAETAAAESEARYREALDSTHDAILGQLVEGVIVTDAAGRITLVNEAAGKILGTVHLGVAPDEYSDTYRVFTEAGVPYASQDLPWPARSGARRSSMPAGGCGAPTGRRCWGSAAPAPSSPGTGDRSAP